MECVSQDVRRVLNPNQGQTQIADSSLLLDYVNRISLQMLRFSRWQFLLSAPQAFVTVPGQTDYWYGPTGSAPLGTVDTGLNLSDVSVIKRDMVYVRGTSYPPQLSPTADPPTTVSLILPSRPLFWRNDVSTPGILNVYPPSDQNAFQQPPNPNGPIATFSAGGSLPLRTYYVKTTLYDSAGGESVTSLENLFVVPAGQLITIKSPVISLAGTSPMLSATCANGVVINHWNVYAAGITGAQDLAQPSNNSETLQASNIAIGTDWTEPTSGLTTTGRNAPGTPTLSLLGGYIIEFRYYQQRAVVTAPDQILQVPDQYKDILCAGVNWLAYKYLKKDDEAQIWMQVYQRGLTEMVKDANLWPRDGEFIRPDPRAVTRSINTGVGLDSGMETSIP